MKRFSYYFKGKCEKFWKNLRKRLICAGKSVERQVNDVENGRSVDSMFNLDSNFDAFEPKTFLEFLPLIVRHAVQILVHLRKKNNSIQRLKGIFPICCVPCIEELQ